MSAEVSTVPDSKVKTIMVILGIIAISTVLTLLYSSDEFSGIDAALDTGLKRLENRFYWVLTTLSSVGYGDIYPVSTRARMTGAAMMLLMIFSIV